MNTITTAEATQWLFQTAQQTPFNIAPERGEELMKEIFGPEKWTMAPSAEPANFFAVPSDKAVYLTAAGQASLWCLAYVAFHVTDIASRGQRAVADRKTTTSFDIGREWAALGLDGYIEFARSLFHADRPWPASLAKPARKPKEHSVEWLINNVYFGALSWILLHEIGHVHHSDIVLVPADIRIRQEYAADDFATTWILDDAGTGLKREFRILMISVALTWLFLLEAERGRGSNHPATILRFREAANQFKGREKSVGLENASYLLKAVLDPSTETPGHETPAESFDWVSSRLEVLFPA